MDAAEEVPVPAAAPVPVVEAVEVARAVLPVALVEEVVRAVLPVVLLGEVVAVRPPTEAAHLAEALGCHHPMAAAGMIPTLHPRAGSLASSVVRRVAPQAATVVNRMEGRGEPPSRRPQSPRKRLQKLKNLATIDIMQVALEHPTRPVPDHHLALRPSFCPSRRWPFSLAYGSLGHTPTLIPTHTIITTTTTATSRCP